mgnify:CR=1 FL=1
MATSLKHRDMEVPFSFCKGGLAAFYRATVP